MLTCEEYLDIFPDKPPEEIHVHGLDLLNHILQADQQQSWYKSNSPVKRHLLDLMEELEQHAEHDELDQVLEDNLTQKDKWTRFDSEEGDIDVERFLEASGDHEHLVFDDYKKQKKPKTAMTLVMDCAIPYVERSLPDMAKRHKEVYTLAVQAYMEGRPCRVIAVFKVKYTEDERARVIFITIKDFSEPIFSGMWGAFTSNKSTNCLLNGIMDYFIGTHDYGNGSPRDCAITKFIPREECELIDPKRLQY